jgi:hypothetical protein
MQCNSKNMTEFMYIYVHICMQYKMFSSVKMFSSIKCFHLVGPVSVPLPVIQTQTYEVETFYTGVDCIQRFAAIKKLKN